MLENLFRKETRTVRDVAISSLCEVIKDYSEWYDEKGLYLPPNFATDPAGWCEALHKMKEAFMLLRNAEDMDDIEGYEKDIVEGLTLFGENLMYMNDPKKENK